jgi:hypothetical protein
MPTPEPGPPSDQPDHETPAVRVAERARRRAAVFGDVLPDQTRDERDPAGAPTESRDDDIRREVPPHHG